MLTAGLQLTRLLGKPSRGQNRIPVRWRVIGAWSRCGSANTSLAASAGWRGAARSIPLRLALMFLPLVLLLLELLLLLLLLLQRSCCRCQPARALTPFSCSAVTAAAILAAAGAAAMTATGTEQALRRPSHLTRVNHSSKTACLDSAHLRQLSSGQTVDDGRWQRPRRGRRGQRAWR
jgi:hypothetical protein